MSKIKANNFYNVQTDHFNNVDLFADLFLLIVFCTLKCHIYKSVNNRENYATDDFKITNHLKHDKSPTFVAPPFISATKLPPDSKVLATVEEDVSPISISLIGISRTVAAICWTLVLTPCPISIPPWVSNTVPSR